MPTCNGVYVEEETLQVSSAAAVGGTQRRHFPPRRPLRQNSLARWRQFLRNHLQVTFFKNS